MYTGIKCHDYGIQGYGNIDKGVVICGIAPAVAELRTGKPFMGQAGGITNAILKATGWHRDWTYCTNMCCWRPADGKADRDPTPTEIKLCIDRLEEELTEIKPKLIIALGALAAQVFTGRPLSQVRGSVIWNGDCYVMATYHTAAILHGGDKGGMSVKIATDIVRDFQKIKDIVKWQKGGPTPYERHIITDINTAQSILNQLPYSYPIALDVETSKKDEDGIDIFVDRMLCLSISNGKDCWYFDADIVNQLEWPVDRDWTFQNGMFDVQALARHSEGKIWLPIVEDTMLQSYTLDERGGYHKLKPLAREYLGAPFYDEAIKVYRKKNSMEQADHTVLQEYNMNDTVYTQRLQTTFRRKQDEDKVRGFYESILIPAANAYAEIQYRGTTIHKENFAMLQNDWVPRQLREQHRVVELAKEEGWDGNINLNSPKQMSKLLYQIIGLEGGPSTARPVIEELEHPFVDALLSYRRLDHMVNSYIFGIQDDVKYDGRVHANVLLHGQVGGRPSYHKPPLQTIPKKDEKMGEDFGRIRSIFGPSSDRYVILEADFSQAEVWVGASYAQDANMLADLGSGDYHGKVCSSVYHLDKDSCDPMTWRYYRNEAKKITFGVMYGSEADGLSHNMRCSKGEAADFIKSFYNRYSDFEAFVHEIHRQALDNGEVITVTGRKRRFPLVFGQEANRVVRQAINFPIQSTASDYTLMSVIKLHPLLKQYDSYILFTVHDSIIFEINKDYIQQVIALIKEVMQTPFFPGFPSIPVDVKWGNDWGSAHVDGVDL